MAGRAGTGSGWAGGAAATDEAWLLRRNMDAIGGGKLLVSLCCMMTVEFVQEVV